MQKKANIFFQIAKINMQKKHKIIFQKKMQKKRCKKSMWGVLYYKRGTPKYYRPVATAGTLFSYI